MMGEVKTDLCIVGAGATGMGLLLLLQDAGVDLTRIVIVDPHFIGGDLARKWTRVISNTPWEKTTNALRRTCPSLANNHELNSHEAGTTTPLIEISHLLRQIATPALRVVKQIQGRATRANYKTPSSQWSITIEAGGTTQTILSRMLIVATGAEPRSMDLSIPSIPLEIALDSNRLCEFIRGGERVIVFGTMHSGTLVLRNLRSCGASVTAFYNTPKPFVWDRDGAYDGLKGEAAEIADAITAEITPFDSNHLEIVPVHSTSRLLRAGMNANWVVYAMGFKARSSLIFEVDGVVRDNSYDGATGAFLELPAAWGFGIAYPNRAPDGVHWDVSVAAFLDHMKTQLPSILAVLK